MTSKQQINNLVNASMEGNWRVVSHILDRMSAPELREALGQMKTKPRYITRAVKYSRNRPNEAQIQAVANQMHDVGYRQTARTEKSPGCLGAISTSIFGGGVTSLTFELKDES